MIQEIRENKVEEVQKIIQSGADINKQSKVGITPLQRVAALEYKETENFLEKTGAK